MKVCLYGAIARKAGVDGITQKSRCRPSTFGGSFGPIEPWRDFARSFMRVTNHGRFGRLGLDVQKV